MKDLNKLGLRGNLPIFIQNFLSERTFQVLLGTIFFDKFKQEEGVPQDAILSGVFPATRSPVIYTGNFRKSRVEICLHGLKIRYLPVQYILKTLTLIILDRTLLKLC